MRKEFIIKEIEEGEILEAVNFHNEFSGGNRTVEEWRHEYKKYLKKHSIFTILKDQDKIIGTIGFLPYYVNFNERKHLVGKGENVLIHPNYRNGVLFRRFFNFTLEIAKQKHMEYAVGRTQLGLVWNRLLKFNAFPNIFSQRMGVIKLRGLNKSLRTLVKRKYSSKSKQLFIRLGLIFCSVFLFRLTRFKMAITKISLASKKKDYEISSMLRDNNDIIKLFQNLTQKQENLICLNQDIDFLNWRIFNSQRLVYKTYFIYKKDKLDGYCYATINIALNTAYLTDFTFNDIKSGKLLLHKVFSDFRKETAPLIFFFGNETNDVVNKSFNLLKKVGFIKIKNPTWFVIKGLSDTTNETQFNNISNWHITSLWTEGFER